MPDTGGGFGARPRRSGFRAASPRPTGRSPDGAQRNPGSRAGGWIPHCASLHAGYLAWPGVAQAADAGALGQIGSHELAALALMLGILSFAVIAAILYVRTRRRLAETVAAAREAAISLKA